MAPPEPTCLLIADITGYTSYLAGVELEHANDILADLMATVVKALRPTFKLSKLEGDAAFVFALTDSVDGSVLLDTAEGSYFAFRNRALSIRQASTCECNACMRIPNLNLKLVGHHGEVVIQRIAGHSELVGRDVILIHRLLKNSIGETAYLFLTDACVEKTTLDPERLGFRRHAESYESIGEVAGWVEDLEAAWDSHRERSKMYVSSDQADFEVSGFIAAPPELVWEFISSPILRPQWSAGITRVDQLDPSGRRRSGTLNHCMHGEDVILQEFVDWRPPRYFTSRVTTGGVKLISTHEVEPADGGSIVRDRFLRPRAKAGRPMFEGFTEMFRQVHPEEMARLTALVVARYAEMNLVDEPELATSDESRRLASPVKS